jgi:hypothetical protein
MVALREGHLAIVVMRNRDLQRHFQDGISLRGFINIWF